MPAKIEITAKKSEREVMPPIHEEVAKVYSLWEEVVEHPIEWLQDMQGTLAYVAGGGLPLVFGDGHSETSEIWDAITASAAEKQGTIEIAGIVFTLEELSLMGDFYRYIKKQGNTLHCIDERLADDLLSVENQVHEHCGACAATHGAIVEKLRSGAHVEDILLSELGEEGAGKQKIYNSMPNHVSLSVFIDFHGDEAVVDEDKRAQLRDAHALAFQVSLPVDLLTDHIEESQLSADQIRILLDVLVKWNVQIARNIIGGDHNQLQAFADETLFIMDKRNVEDHPLLEELQTRISQIAHRKELIVH